MDQSVRMTHDPEADAAYIYLSDPIEPGGVSQSRVLDHYTTGASVTLDFDGDNRLLGIELLGFSLLVPTDVVRRVNEVGG